MFYLLAALPVLLLGGLLLGTFDSDDDADDTPPDPNAGNQNLEGSDGPDDIRAGAGDDRVLGWAGDDDLRGQEGDDSLDGGPGADAVWGDLGDDSLFGGDGNDDLTDGFGTNLLDGGAGADRISAADDASAPGADTVFGGAGWDRIVADLGDTISSGTGEDTLIVSLDRGDGDAVLVTDFDPTRDVLALTWGGESGATAPASVTATETPDGVTLTFGTGGPRVTMQGLDLDTLLAHPAALQLNIPGGGLLVPAGATVTGTAGNDTLADTAGDDLLSGLDGDDTLFSENGTDIVLGGAGNDWVFASGDAADIDAGAGDDSVYLAVGIDGLANVALGDGNDQAIGDGTARATIAGGAGNDSFNVLGGGYVLQGGDGDDSVNTTQAIGPRDSALTNTIDGGAGDDIISAGYGDIVTGGSGQDSFIAGLPNVLGNPITITDFDPATESLQLFLSAPGSLMLDDVTVVAGTAPGEALVQYDGQTVVRLQGIDDIAAVLPAVSVASLDGAPGM